MSGPSSSLMPSEEWPPYRWVWSHLVLGRNERGEPIPYTHVMRRNPKVVLPAMLGLLAVFLLWSGRKWWPTLLAFSLGALAGHVWW